MVVERFDTFLQWLLPSADRMGALIYFGLMAAGGAVFGIFCAYLIAAFRHGLGEGFYSVATTIAGAVPDFLRVSPRRTLAIAHLAIKESFRARVAVAFVVFLVVLMYARWFLDVDSDDPAKLYMMFVINATTLLMLVVAVFLSTFSLPADIKSRTIYTIVTKPVRASEIIVGRMLGFSFVGSMILLGMGVVGYVFVVRGLSHQHQVDAPAEEIAAALEADGFWKGHTTLSRGHRHEITITKDGEAFETGSAKDHKHYVTRQGDAYFVGKPVDQLRARVPRYGKLRFISSTGAEGGGISVGKEWSYRKYIEGETLASAVWVFDGIRADRFHDELPLELTLSVFRTHKGDIRSGVKGSITLKNPDPAAAIRQSVPITFNSREFETDRHVIPREVQAVRSDGEAVAKADIFEDLCDENGRLEVWLRCEDRQQYFGVSQGDLYMLEAERSFAANYAKGFLGIWMAMLLVICFGVMVSSRLNGAISMLATVCYVVMGLYREQIVGVFKGQWANSPLLTSMFGSLGGKSEQLVGGGPIESMIRMMTQKNLTTELDLGWLTEGLIRWSDFALQAVILAVTHFAPDFNRFNTATYLAEGYDINAHLVATQSVTCLSYLLMMAVVGYFFFKTREIAA